MLAASEGPTLADSAPYQRATRGARRASAEVSPASRGPQRVDRAPAAAEGGMDTTQPAGTPSPRSRPAEYGCDVVRALAARSQSGCR